MTEDTAAFVTGLDIRMTLSTHAIVWVGENAQSIIGEFMFLFCRSFLKKVHDSYSCNFSSVIVKLVVFF